MIRMKIQSKGLIFWVTARIVSDLNVFHEAADRQNSDNLRVARIEVDPTPFFWPTKQKRQCGYRVVVDDNFVKGDFHQIRIVAGMLEH
mmetsp:Transcript_38232/g.109914  ORF Transcript_38232/g.109914 Transcript_38232/m.109914 type:complete len:88 (-) Transcript_38232:260-523(-)